MAQKASSVSVYTCRSSQLLTQAILFLVLGLFSGVTLAALLATPGFPDPDQRALWMVALGVLAALGVMNGLQLLTVWRWVGYVLSDDGIRCIVAPTGSGKREIFASWGVIEAVESADGHGIRIAGELFPIPSELVGSASLLKEIAERTRERIPYPNIPWPGNVTHANLDDRLLAKVQTGILAGQTIAMMKVVQDATGIRSKECLDLVERLRRALEAARSAR